MERKKKRPCDYQIGDRVSLIDANELQDIYECYLQQTLSSKDLKILANHIVTIVWVPKKTELNSSWDGCLKVQTDQKVVYKLPFAAIVEIPEEGYVEEPDDEGDAKPDLFIVRDRDSENNLVQQLAAETIQSTFRSHSLSPPHSLLDIH
jgi:hypothetical protein